MAKKLILLIDHEPSVRTVLQVCLSQIGGWNVHSVPTLSQGIAVLNHLKPEAIVLDAPTLDVDGCDVIHELRQWSAPLNIPILLITGKAKWFSRHQLAEMGVVGALPKPFNPLTLPNQMRELLNWQDELSENNISP